MNDSRDQDWADQLQVANQQTRDARAENELLRRQPDPKTGICACCGLNAWAMANAIEEAQHVSERLRTVVKLVASMPITATAKDFDDLVGAARSALGRYNCP